MKKIAHIETDFSTKFGLPRQSRLVEGITGKIVFEKEYRVKEAFRGLEDYSHIWILWEFSEAKQDKWSPTVRPPLLGGNKRMGVFATRSPFRPNPIGLSCVELLKVELDDVDGPVLYVSGVDIMNGTPIYDIKPYLSYADSVPDAVGGFTENLKERRLSVDAPEDILNILPKDKRQTLLKVLESDPRPSYIDDADRVYGFNFAGYEVKFTVNNNKLTLKEITQVQ